MSFHILKDSMSADASDMNDNFYHIGQGTRLPMGGASMGYTNNAYNIGLSVAAWKDVYANKLIFNEVNHAFELLANTTLASDTSRVEITGLNGNTYKLFTISLKLKNSIATAASYYIFFNGDSSAAYNFRYAYYNKTGADHGVDTGVSGLRLAQTTNITNTTHYAISEITLFPRTDSPKIFISKYSSDISIGNVQESMYGVGSWSNTSSTLTSIQITGSTSTAIGTGSIIKIRGMK